MFKWIKSGAPWIWLTGGAVSLSLISVLGLLLLIGWKGLTYFWPAPLYQWQTSDGKKLIGQLYSQEQVPLTHLREVNIDWPPEAFVSGEVNRLSIKVANRELTHADFVSILDVKLSDKQKPSGWAVIERVRDGQFYGKPIAYLQANGQESLDAQAQLEQGMRDASLLREKIDNVITEEIRVIGNAAEKLRLEKRRKELNGQLDETYLAQYRQRKEDLDSQLVLSEQKLDALRAQLNQQSLIVEDMTGSQIYIPLSQILDIWYPNDMDLGQKVTQWGKQVWVFLSQSPRESNSEGGVFPAIFGTVFLVLIMSIIVMPLGVVAAIYLHEYAKDNAFTRVIRVAVINLAGVPSIVYGVFGLGFFVYTIGSSIDALFYAERLPAPTFGTPGLLWSALTLAVLTLPVVIVTTEEGLTRIPSSVRHGSLALGATQFETIWRIVLPMASPAIITGLILAIARAAGEVAPLMLVGVVKLASSLPVDGEFPFVHLERKFMHLGFHIYDVGFQTTNIETARPLVYATSFLLVTVIVALNLTAISIRNNLREKYRTLGQD
ncbi:phosphate ABC transporter permease PstA [Vibrio aestuarianus]|uniref:Phosphate transport system permease protein PstA n=1 Tax=Vibrio aestuarianus TaxID=28171 RepID=A0A9X4FA87_9VIBR|nr:phosphate ABC transporter permease PstA [Vibrio aestuarianus]MDE1235684.1 phosphate ABC transporter permease PstA [Vibrio aestuarianus]MDE1246584.1 phosphate ABC transporter permease PstA [Vibrio aestuarianus]MDE1331504.1 phosphate ABC transporter permease PstA [Vibrio aestuarianus]MDE1347303.1 phosphate ABC transporter permease PstA [Vibrio aestuarianus]NGZ63621.1 phosphate ABC transporter permease PstA [Vibrio aestuarianus subsp. cardii]